MLSHLTIRRAASNPSRSELGAGTYALSGCLGLFVDETALAADWNRLPLTSRSVLHAGARADLGGGMYALATTQTGLVCQDYVLAAGDWSINTLRMDGVGGATFSGTHRQRIAVADDLRMGGVGSCEFLVAAEVRTLRMDGVGGCMFIPTVQRFLSMDGVGGCLFAAAVRVSDLRMGGIGGMHVDGGRVARQWGEVRMDGQGGMAVLMSADIRHIAGDGNPPGSGATQRWNYAF